MSTIRRIPIANSIRQGWIQARIHWHQHPRLRETYYWAYVIFFCGFLFFPSSKTHNNFYYGFLLVPSLLILSHLFTDFYRNRLFSLVTIYLAYLVLTNFWGINVNLENVAEQIKHLLYVLAFIAASIVIEACYPEKANRLLVILAWASALAFAVSILWWYQTHAFPTTRLNDMLGRMDNPILAGCISGVACLVLIEILPKQDGIYRQVAAGAAFLINLMFIMLSQSRTALAALIPALVVLAIPYLHRNGRLIIIAAIFTAVIGFSLQDALIAGLSRNSYRVDIWLATLDRARSSLWWGQGYFCDTVALRVDGLKMLHAHNVYLAALRDGGLIGLLLLLGPVLLAMWRAWRQALATKHYLTLALVVFGALAVFFDNDRLVDNPEELWIFFWYPLCRVMAHDLVREGLLPSAQPAYCRCSS